MLHIIYNPIAGHGKAASFYGAVEARLIGAGAEYRFYETTEHQDAWTIAHRLTLYEEGTVDIVAMGGDGTLHEVLNGLVAPGRVRLGLIPCGGGNDFAAAAGIPVDACAATDILLHGQAKPTDYMQCGGVRGMNLIGAGFDVDTLRIYNRQRLKGSLGYAVALLRALIHFRFYDFNEDLGGKLLPHSALIACVGNGRSCGGGITLCPEASIDDGQLDILIVDGLKKLQIPGALIKLIQKRLTDLPFTHVRRGKGLRIISDTQMPIQIDGEIYGNLPFDVQLMPGGILMFRP